MRFAAVIGIAGLLWTHGVGAQVLMVDSVSGAVSLEAGDEGADGPLVRDTQVTAGDRLATGSDGQVRLILGRYGFIDVGPGSELRVERLPHASFAPDLRSDFRLISGFARLVWKHPQISTVWPISIDIKDSRLSVTPGEFFFETKNDRAVACVASGKIRMTGAGGSASLHPEACYHLDSDGANRVRRDAGAWIAMRGEQRVGTLPGDPAQRARSTTPQPVSAPAPAESSAGQAPASSASDDGKTGAGSADRVARADDTSSSEEATPDSVAPARGNWALSVASLHDSEAAKDLAAQLRDGGYRVELVAVDVRGSAWTRVLVTGYASVAAARRSAQSIADDFGLDDAWVLKHPVANAD